MTQPPPGYPMPPEFGPGPYGQPQPYSVPQTPPPPKRGGGRTAAKIIGSLVILAIVFVLGIAVGSGGQKTAAKTAESTGVNHPSASATPSTTATQAAETTTAAPPPTTSAAAKYAKFGDTYTWKDGVSITISAPAPYTPANRYTTIAPGTSGLSFTVTIVNSSTAEYNPGMFHASAQSGNVEADQIFDSAGGLGGQPETVVLPTREVSFPIGFAVTNPADIVMQVSPGYSYKDSIFTS
jgi:hypothetical protein